MVSAGSVVALSRAQFAFTALFHFLFVPLTLGLTWLCVAMEAAYVKTGKVVYQDMTRFWGKLLAINFAMGVITGLTLEFEFGTNWAYFARVIGGSFGPVLAIEGITAFMLETTMFGLFFFGWKKLSKRGHFLVTIFMALGASLSVVNILAANSWMQHPVATHFNPLNMTFEMKSIAALYMLKLSQVRVGHVLNAGFLTAAMFMMGISAYYILHHRDVAFAKRSFSVAAGFGLICCLVVAFFGDQNGLLVSKNEPEKMAAIEAQWYTQKAPAAWYVFTIPDQKLQKNFFTIAIPDGLSLIATHSLTGTVEGIQSIEATYRQDIKNGIKAYVALEQVRHKVNVAENIGILDQYQKDIGFGLLLSHFAPDVAHATPAEISETAKAAIPNVFIAFYSFRIMIFFWLIMFLLCGFGVFFSLRDTLANHRRYLRLTLYLIPVPYLAAEFGWILAEVGRQPWVIHQYLPTFMGVSSVDMGALIFSLSGFVLFYVLLFIIELFLMFKYARLGPSSLGSGRYYFESQDADR